MSTQTYIQALRYNWLTKFYDFLLSITFPEKKIKQALINQLNLTGSETILDFGYGTATLKAETNTFLFTLKNLRYVFILCYLVLIALMKEKKHHHVKSSV